MRLHWVKMIGLARQSRKTRAGVRFNPPAKRPSEPDAGTLPEAEQGGCWRRSQENKPRIS